MILFQSKIPQTFLKSVRSLSMTNQFIDTLRANQSVNWHSITFLLSEITFQLYHHENYYSFSKRECLDISKIE